MGLRSAFQISIIAKNWVNERTKWFIDLRWLAVLGAAGVVSIASLALNIDLPLRWLYGGAAFLAGYLASVLNGVGAGRARLGFSGTADKPKPLQVRGTDGFAAVQMPIKLGS